MYNIKSSEIFDLIRSLSKSDKRYFKIYANRYRAGEKNYIKLFDCIDKMHVYNEEYIQKIFSEKKLLTQLPRIKNYLYNLILNSLEANSTRDTFTKQIRKLLNHVETLCNLSLYDQGLKILEKAKHKAYRHGDLLKIIEIFNEEYRLVLRKGNVDEIGPYIQRFQDEFYTCIDKYVNLQKYNLLSLRMEPVIYMKSGKADGIEKIVQPVLEDILLSDISKALTPTAKIRFHHIHAVYYFLSGRIQKAYEHFGESIVIFEEYTDQCGGPLVYVNTLHNYFITQFMLHKFKEALQTNMRIQELLSSSIIHFGGVPVRHMLSAHERKLNLYLILGNIKEGIKTIGQTDVFIKKHFHRLRKMPLIYYNYLAAVFFFFNGEYSNALSRVNIILNKRVKDYLQADQVGAHILNLLIHYELGNEVILDNQLRSSERYLKKLRKLNQQEELMMRYFKIVHPKVITQTELLDSMKKLKNDLEIITLNPIMEDNFSPIYWMAWLESKIKKRVLSDTYKDMIGKYVNNVKSGNVADIFENFNIRQG